MLHTRNCKVIDEPVKNLDAQPRESTIFKQMYGPFFFLAINFHENGCGFCFTFMCDFNPFVTVGTSLQLTKNILGPLKVELFITGDELHYLRIAFHDFHVLMEVESTSKRYIKTNGFQRINDMKAEIKRLHQCSFGNSFLFDSPFQTLVRFWSFFGQFNKSNLVLPLTSFIQNIIIVMTDGFCALHDCII